MDLSFSRFEHDSSVTALPPDLAVLMVGIAARQATSLTALIESRSAMPLSTPVLLHPTHGAFNRAMAATIRRWCKE
ncbi:MAG: hypothetical protein BVN32_12310 [Proteobacteria bacterium ST_bin14]|nr:MAG: hypothetical protein BVN32_12310 [Proteobacteria bacterium ST_bin14]